MEVPRLIKDLLVNRKFVVGFLVFLVILLTGVIGPLLYPVDSEDMSFLGSLPPSPGHPLGTDYIGRDVLAQLLRGITASLYVGFLAGTIALTIGVVVGAVAAVKGGIIDEILMSLTNAVLLMPTILVLILIAALFKTRSIELVATLIGVTSWPWRARVVRGEFMSLKERDFVYMSVLAGEKRLNIAIFDLLPNMATYIAMSFAELVAGAILQEAGISFIGLGPTEGVTLGRVFFWIQTNNAIIRGLWWWWLPTTIMIVAIATSLVLISISFDEVFNPRLRGR
ncbi:MAG: ABC transporter permease [Ignisphaera sp.]